MMIIGLVGYNTYEGNGLPHRFPLAIRNIFDYRRHYQNSFENHRKRTCFLVNEQDESQFDACTDNEHKSVSDGLTIWSDLHTAHLRFTNNFERQTKEYCNGS